MIDWNGNIYLCPQDWHRRIAMGNIMQNSKFEIWTKKIITKYRKSLLKGKRENHRCSNCNAEGTVLGKNHTKAWEEIYKI